MTSAGSTDDYIHYRFNRAKKAFDEALILEENKKWNTVINRLYYSSFYAASNRVRDFFKMVALGVKIFLFLNHKEH